MFETGGADQATIESDRYGSILVCPICDEQCRHSTSDNLTRCDACQHIFQTDLNVTVAYDAEYAHQYDHRPVKEMSGLRWDFIQSHLGLSAGSRVLDIGYGNAAFLKYAQAAGMEIYGIDVHQEDFGVPVIDFDSKLNFDLICFFDSLEHFPDFDSVTKLRSNNVIVSIPNTPRRLLSSPTSWRHYKPGEHLHYFSQRSLDLFMANWGFPRRIADGYPEDNLRGKLTLDHEIVNNIYTAIYSRT